MTALEQRDRTPLEPRVEKALWLFENAGAPELIRQYVRDKLAALYLTLGGDPQTTTPKKLMRRALGIITEVVEVANGSDSSIEPRFVLAAQYALKPEPTMASIALDNAEGKLVRGIRAMSRLSDLQEKDFQVIQGKGSHFMDAALLIIANEILDRDKKGETALDEPHEIISLDVRAPDREESVIQETTLSSAISTPQDLGSNLGMDISTDRYKVLFDKGRDFRSLADRNSHPLKEIQPPTDTSEQTGIEVQRPTGSVTYIPVPGETASVREITKPAREPRKIRNDHVSLGPKLGHRIEELRNVFGFSRVQFLGRGRDENLRQIELGLRNTVSKSLIQEIAERFGISLADLLNVDVSIEAILSKNPTPNPVLQGRRKGFYAELKREPKEVLSDEENGVKRFQEGLKELKRRGTERIGKKNLGELFLYRDENGQEYSLVQDGRLRIRSKTGNVRMERFEDTTNSAVISALQRSLDKQ